MTGPPDEVVVETTPTFGDYLRLLLRFSFRQARVVIVFASLAVLVFLVAPMMPSKEANATLVERYWAYKFILILPAIVFVFLPLSVYLTARARWAKAPELREPRTYRFNEQGLSLTAESFGSSFAWSHITRAEKFSGLLALVTAQQAAYLIPWTDITRQGVQTPLMALIHRHVRAVEGLPSTVDRKSVV